MVVDAIEGGPVGAARSRFTDNGRPLDRLHIERERLTRRESLPADQNVQIFVRDPVRPRNGVGPNLASRVLGAVVKIRQVSFLFEEVAAEQRRTRLPPMVVPKVQDDAVA